VTGYKSTGDEGTITLVLGGDVAPAGTATYWFETGDGVFPATGPGLSCAESTTEFTLQQTPAATQVPDEGKEVAAPETGELLVLMYTCTDVPEDRTGYDWFGECDPEGGVHDFTLTDVTWCRAASDNVDPEGNVTIVAGERTTVWGFICQ
jgi:hypothetical protein